MGRICNKCESYKEASFFSKRKDGTLYSHCKKCKSDTYTEYYAKNAKLVKERMKSNPNTKISSANWYIKNKEKLAKSFQDNKKAIYKQRILHRETNIEAKLKHNLRSRFNNAIKRNSKTGSAVRELGCSIVELKQYLESKFEPGMTWNNYGKEWHVDHVKPLALFNLKIFEQLQDACKYTNLQPLWATDNLKKGKSYGN